MDYSKLSKISDAVDDKIKSPQELDKFQTRAKSGTWSVNINGHKLTFSAQRDGIGRYNTQIYVDDNEVFNSHGDSPEGMDLHELNEALGNPFTDEEIDKYESLEYEKIKKSNEEYNQKVELALQHMATLWGCQPTFDSCVDYMRSFFDTKKDIVIDAIKQFKSKVEEILPKTPKNKGVNFTVKVYNPHDSFPTGVFAEINPFGEYFQPKKFEINGMYCKLWWSGRVRAFIEVKPWLFDQLTKDFSQEDKNAFTTAHLTCWWIADNVREEAINEVNK